MQKHNLTVLKLILVAQCLALACGHSLYAQGLRFSGNEKHIPERSSLLLYNPAGDGNPIDNYQLDFNLRIHNIESPGYIFYLRNKKGSEAWNFIVSYNSWEKKATLSLSKNGEKALFTTTYPTDKLREKPIAVSLKIDAKANKGSIKVGDNEAEIVNFGINADAFEPELTFGMTQNIVESASFSIRDVVLSDSHHSTRIPLCESQGTAVHDAEGNVIGEANNPQWLISYSYRWQPIISLSSPSPTGFAFSEAQQRFFSFNTDSLRSYDLFSRELTSSKLKGSNLPVKLGMNIFDEEKQKILPYEIAHFSTFGEINPAEATSNELATTELRMALHHHAAAYRKKDNSLLIFGGYGNRSYSDKLLRYDFNENRWDTLKLAGDRIPPRFYASMMTSPSGDSLYIYGGKGNLDGNQDLGVRYYYDCYLVDLNSLKAKKLWEQTPPAIDKVPARTLVPDRDGKGFYAMMYPEYRPHSSLQLYQISLADGAAIAVGDSIPMVSEEIATNVALYPNPNFGNLFCVIQEFEKEGATSTRVYTIAYPPVAESQIGVVPAKRHRALWWILGGLLVAAVVALICFYPKKKRAATPKDSEYSPQDSEPTPKEPEPVEFDPAPIIPDPIEEPKPNLYALPASNRISLFGTFTVLDAKGSDIAYMFSPKLKAIFLYILLATESKGGVQSSDLNAIFWPDKPADKVKNLRNVTLNKLRKILTEMEGIELTYNKGMFFLSIAPGCFCDYSLLRRLTSGFKDINLSNEAAHEIAPILYQGKFLLATDEPEFDNFKQEVEQFMVRYLSGMTEKYYREGRFTDTLRLANSLLLIEPTSDIALKHGILAYRKMGLHDRAAVMYANFSKEYLRLMGEPYPIPLADITD